MRSIETPLNALQLCVEAFIQVFFLSALRCCRYLRIFTHTTQGVAVEIGTPSRGDCTSPPSLQKTIFLINNYNLILTAYRAQHIQTNDTLRYNFSLSSQCPSSVFRYSFFRMESLVQQHTAFYVKEQLKLECFSLVRLIQKTDNLLSVAGSGSTNHSITDLSFDAETLSETERVVRQQLNISVLNHSYCLY